MPSAVKLVPAVYEEQTVVHLRNRGQQREMVASDEWGFSRLGNIAYWQLEADGARTSVR